QPLGVASEIKREAALGTKKIAVVARKVAIIGADDFVVAHAERRLAAIGTVRAHGGYVLHLPRTCVIAVGAAGQRPDRTYIDAHAALDAFEMAVAIRNDHRIGSALAYAESLDVHAFVAHAHASEAKDAARRVVIDDVGPFHLGHVQFFFHKTAAVRAVAEGHV